MRALGNSEFLRFWESGRRLHPLDRGLLAIRASCPDASNDSVADWPLGRRNQALAQLHALYFGPRLRGWTGCARCGEKLEFEVDFRTLSGGDALRDSEPIVVKGCAFRLPTTRDLARLVEETDSERAALRLVNDCRIDGPATERWSDDELGEIGERLAEADPLAEIALAFQCPVCDAASEEVLDLPSFLWTELDSRARRLLLEVHTLASAYGWTEGEILALSAARRAAYLEMVAA